MIIILPILLSLIISILKNDKEKIISVYSIYILIFYLINISYGNNILYILFVILILYWLNTINYNNSNLFSLYILIGGILVFNTNSIYSYFISIELITFIGMIYINIYIQDKNIGIIYYLMSGLFSSIFIFSFGYLVMGYYIGYSFIILIFIWKLNLIPFHILMPSIYNNLSPKLIFYIDIPTKILILYLLYKIVLSININFFFIIIINIIITTIIIIIENNLINILIYSSLLNYSLILIFIQYNYYNYFLIYLIFYSFMILIYLYLIIFKYISINFSFYNPFYILIWSLLIFNLIGIPPFMGFYIKLLPLSIILNHGEYLIAILLIICFILISFIYLKILGSFIFINGNYKTNLYIKTKSNYYHFISSLIVLLSFPIFLF
jgi:NADH:ubiquinone oxidoreductase subunit 2 (subunit N)